MDSLLSEVCGRFDADETVHRTEKTDAPSHGVAPAAVVLEAGEHVFGRVLLRGACKKHDDDDNVADDMYAHH